MLDYIRIGCAVPAVKLADPGANAESICRYIRRAEEQNCDLVVFPELAMTGYTCADLFFQESLLRDSIQGLQRVAGFSTEYPGVTAVVGLPVCMEGRLYNCAAVVSGGKVRGLVPKTCLPNYGEFLETRWFSSGENLRSPSFSAACLGLSGNGEIPVGRDLIFRIGDGVLLGIEICEDLWSPIPPSTLLAFGGAEVIVNPAASDETVNKRSYRRNLVSHQSAVCGCVYACCCAGSTESTQDLVFSGHSMVAENGAVVAENQKLIDGDYLLVCDADMGKIRADRRRNKSLWNGMPVYRDWKMPRIVDCQSKELRGDGSLCPIQKMPFVPRDPQQRQERARSVFEIQVEGLKRRLSAIHANAVVGVSGGLDSTLALLVAVEAMHRLGRPVSDVHGITMPCFGTTDRTYRNAVKLMELLGVTVREIDIRQSVEQHFRDIGHDPLVHDTAYENAQARERTQVLMDYAGKNGGIVIGTGDMSELALGWCTYNGDHMSMYAVNSSVPKTLVYRMIQSLSQLDTFVACADVLMDILDTPISPELLPPDGRGEIVQHTEDLVGPYALHDFFLYYAVRFGFAPGKIYRLACRAFSGEYDSVTVKKWMRVFYQRFFSQQFKRNCVPDGVKTGSVSLGPRGDWHMPSDATAALWLEEVNAL